MGCLLRFLNPESGTHWDKTRLYKSSTEHGTYVKLIDIDSSNTSYWDENSATTDWYKLAFYDTVNAVESDLTDAFTVNTVPAISPKELRWHMGLTDVEDPKDDQLVSLILDANTELSNDADGGVLSGNNRKLALKYLTAAFVALWRGQRLISSGNVNFAIDGVSIQKPYQFWMDRAKFYREMYNDFMYKFMTQEIITTPLADQGYEEYALYVCDILHGGNNARNSPDMRNNSDNTVYLNSSNP